MVSTCCVVYCHRRRNKEGGRSFHKFPWKYGAVARNWVSIISRQNEDGTSWQPTRNDRVCSDHFTEADYRPHTKTRTLCRNALPTIFVRCSPKKTNSFSRKIPAPFKQTLPPIPKERLLQTSQLPPSKKRPFLKQSTPSETPASNQQRLLKIMICDHPYSKKSAEEDLDKEKTKNKILMDKMINAIARKRIKAMHEKLMRKSKKVGELMKQVERIKSKYQA